MFHVDPAEPLSEHGAVAACCHDDLDLGGRTTLLDALATTSAATTASPPTIVLDLARISFIDAAGLGALIFVRQHAAGRGGRLVLRNPARCVSRLLAVTGVTDSFVVEHTARHIRGSEAA